MGEAMGAIKSFLFENLLSVSVEYGKDFLKEEAIPLITSELVQQGGSVLIDYGSSMIPGIGGAISEYRTGKKIRNVEKMITILNERHDTLKEKFEKQTEKNKETLDSIFEMVLGKIENTSQEEKISFMVDGYSEFLDLENPSFDVAYLYFDTLDKLTLLDIDVLKLSYRTKYFYMRDTVDGYDGPANHGDILTKYDIEYQQYEAIRANLLRLGLLENEYDDKIEKDYKSVEQAIKELKVTVTGLYDLANGKKTKVKKLSSKSDVKFKAKDRLKISKFGRDFVTYFLVEIK